MSPTLQQHRPRGTRPRRLAALLVAVAFLLVVGATAYALLDGGGARGGEPAAGATTTTAATTTAPPPTGALPPTATTSSTTVPPSSASSVASTTTSPSSTTTTIYTHAIPNPARVVIPAIEVDAKLVPVGLLDGGYMEVPPFGVAGWYEPGPLPGAGGPTVIVAHVDTKKGPDVFYHLRDLEPGDEVLVHDASGDVATFVIDTKEQESKTELPVERIWNDTWEPVIRLITCAGDFDRKTGHYLANLIVYGRLAR